jgi:hypothetical protein
MTLVLIPVTPMAGNHRFSSAASWKEQYGLSPNDSLAVDDTSKAGETECKSTAFTPVEGSAHGFVSSNTKK